jgi:hypothetical protein
MKKRFFTTICSLLFISIGFGQLGAAPTGEQALFDNAAGGNPMLNLVFADLRDKKQTTFNEEIMGSPYLNEKFVKSKVYYSDELIGNFYIRFNALNSEIELKESLDQENTKRLLADKNLSVQYGTKTLRFTTYVNKKSQTKNGYLSMIHDGNNYKLFHRLAIKYVEGKSAANSMVNSVPSRYVPFEEFYYEKQNANRIDYLAQKKGKFLKQIKKEHKDKVKIYLEENKLDFDKEIDLIKLFEYLNTL